MRTSSTDNIFNNLATLSEAGISTLQAARRVAASHPQIKAWEGVIEKLSAGHKLSIALGKSGLISSFEEEIISVSEFAGRTPQGLRGIADSYDKRRQRVGRLKSKLYFPVAVLMIAIVVSTILAVSGNQGSSIIMELGKALVYVLIVIISTKYLLGILKKDSSGFLNQAQSWSSTRFYKHLYEQTVFGALLWYIKSGVDFQSGFSRISKLIKSKQLKRQLQLVSRSCGQGITVVEAVRKACLPITKDFEQVLITAEASGGWENAVENYLQHQLILLDLQIDHAFEWAPRFYYLVSAVVAINIIL